MRETRSISWSESTKGMPSWLRDEPADRGFAGTHQTDEDEIARAERRPGSVSRALRATVQIRFTHRCHSYSVCKRYRQMRRIASSRRQYETPLQYSLR